ncbi:hypothetical protein FACS1894163_01070 [Spirochaetia bacterium]|nr:hypothetical protein FACS1894163_01070 [Spirochaetia bacterium]
MSRVDHDLDKKIPFRADRIGVYHDFTAFWIRSLGFLLEAYGKKAPVEGLATENAIRDFLGSIGAIYAYAAEVYQKNLSTTERPFYLGRPGFLMIHLFDPHLMCIPSLHVMVVVGAYTKFAAILRSLGDGETYAPQIAELKKGALEITETILYVKQHSVNCIAASMYAMTCFNEELFPPSEAKNFVSRLFSENPLDDAGDCTKIRNHIEDLYRHFLAERPRENTAWDMPLINFLRSRQKNKEGSYVG